MCMGEGGVCAWGRGECAWGRGECACLGEGEVCVHGGGVYVCMGEGGVCVHVGECACVGEGGVCVHGGGGVCVCAWGRGECVCMWGECVCEGEGECACMGEEGMVLLCWFPSLVELLHFGSPLSKLAFGGELRPTPPNVALWQLLTVWSHITSLVHVQLSNLINEGTCTCTCTKALNCGSISVINTYMLPALNLISNCYLLRGKFQVVGNVIHPLLSNQHALRASKTSKGSV